MGASIRRRQVTPRRSKSASKPADATNFLVGVVRWLTTDAEGALHAGIRVIPGLPRAVAARPTGINAQAEKFAPALYCPALAALATPASLILPPGWYRPKRVLERGSDFERVAIEPAR